MTIGSRHVKYQAKFLAGPLVAYGSYIVLCESALFIQSGRNISFAFLMFWGIVLFLTTVILSLFGFIHRKKLKQPLLIINTAISLAIIVFAVLLQPVVHKTQTANYACDDFVRCLFSSGDVSHRA